MKLWKLTILSPKKFWYGSSFQTRLMVLLALLVNLTAAVIIAIAAQNYRQDKIAYIYELNHARGKSLMVRGRSALADDAAGAPFEITDRSQKQLDAWKLPRWPEAGEVFVGIVEEKPLLIGKSRAGEFWSKPFASVVPPWDAADDTSYWITSYGHFLGTNRPKLVPEKTVGKRGAVVDFLRSNLIQGLVTVEQGGESVIAAYREVPGTNVNVFVETSVTKAMAPLRRFLLLSVIAGLVFVSLAIMVGLVLLRGITRPLKEVQRIANTVAKGNYSFRVQHPYNDELRQVFEHLGHMAFNLKAREEGLVRLKNSIEHLLEGTRNMAAATERGQVATLAAQSAAGDIRVNNNCNAWIYLLKKEGQGDEQRTVLWGGQVLSEGEPSDSKLGEGSCPDVKDHEEIFLQNGPALAPRLHKVFIPVVHAEERLGFLVIDGYTEPTLHPEDRAFLETLSASLAISLQNILYLEDVREKTRIDTELGAARSVQESLLPEVRVFDGIEVAAHYCPAEAAGGDWYGYTYNEEEKIFYFYLGDVTGHGIPAALMTGVAFGAVRAGELALRGIAQFSSLSVQDRLIAMAQQTNQIVAESGKGRLVMTMSFMALDTRSGQCHLLNAGQTSPFHIKAAEKKAKPLVGGGGSILGTRSPGEFEVSSFQMQAGDSVFLYTDGLVENCGPTGVILKKKKLQELLQVDAGVEDIMSGLLRESRKIWLSFPPKDDLSCLLVRWVPTMDATVRVPLPEVARNAIAGAS